MVRFLFFRLTQSLLLIAGVVALVFFMVRLTGDPASLMLAREATDEQRIAFRAAYGLDRPLPEQLVGYFGGLLRGDLGDSLRLNIPNRTLISQRLTPTLELAVFALVLSLAVSLPLGIAAGLYPRSWMDSLARVVGLAGQTIPSFWLAMILILVFAVRLRWLPSFGRDSFASLLLPGFALALGSIGQLVRLTRSVVLEIRSEHYVRTAYAKGIGPAFVAWRHIAPNAALPLISVIGIQFTYLLGGSVYIETIFSWPGLGSLLNNAINDSDYPLVQAITIFIALFAISVHMLTDIAYGWLDPRVRLT